jgi:hypothetical protein
VFPVKIDHQEIIRFIDTPGFQAPKQALAWMRNYDGPGDQLLETFLEANRGNPLFKDECELLYPVSQGAGIIYVVDASRPLRKGDKAEMEILRLVGRPRMAIINCKGDEQGFLAEWKSEFIKHFNSIRVFSAHKATYAERLDLLESLKVIEQDWQPLLERVIHAFKQDWDHRNIQTAELICSLMIDCMTHTVKKKFSRKADIPKIQEKLMESYKTRLVQLETKSHLKIKALFKHNIFQYDLPAQSIVDEGLFSAKTWQVLGLTPTQFAATAAVAGGALGACVDIAAAGLSFGIFTAIGGAIGAGSALLGGERLAKTKISGLNVGGYQVTIGPNSSIQFFYVLLDRALIFYSHIINWAHGRRDYGSYLAELRAQTARKKGFTANWDSAMRKICNDFLKNIRASDYKTKENTKKQFIGALKQFLDVISESQDRKL